MIFFIEQYAHNEDQAHRLALAAEELGHDVRRYKYIPFGGMYDLIADAAYEELTAQPVVAYCSLNMVADFQKNKQPQKPFAWCDWDILRCQHYYSYYGEWLLQKDYSFMPMSELKRLKKQIFSDHRLSSDKNLFIRPDGNDKCFTGDVVSEDFFDVWYKLAKTYDPPDHTLCVISKPVVLTGEWRLVVADGKVIAGSLYNDGGGLLVEPGYPPEAAELAELAAKKWTPHPIFICDIARNEEGQYSICEIGSVNVAGFYGCEVHPIVEAMAEIAEREYGK
jgi:hypothetical protein